MTPKNRLGVLAQSGVCAEGFAKCLLLVVMVQFAAAGALRGLAPGLATVKPERQQGLLNADEAASPPQASLYGTIVPKAYPGIFDSWSQVVDRATGVNASISDDPEVYGSFIDNYPTFYPAPSGQKSVFCMVRKCGSSRWKYLLYRQLDPSVFYEHKSVHWTPMSWVSGLSRDELVQKVSDPSALRFMWVRNPYSRLLSGFLDKAVNAPEEWKVRFRIWEFGGPYGDSPEEFLRFVKMMLKLRSEGKHIDPHFTPQAEHCGLPQGVRYDFYLKVEDMENWYADLIHILGMEETVSSGWGPESNPGAAPDTPECFYPLPGTTCAETTRMLQNRPPRDRSHHGSLHLSALHHHEPRSRQSHDHGALAWMNTHNSKHSHGADLHLLEYYTTQEVVDLATEFLQADLTSFEYPELDISSAARSK